MSSPKYTGMNRHTGEALDDLAHIRQSVSDVLMTPLGTRLMRRRYGSLLSALIGMPNNDALRLQIMSACYMALLQWEPRITLTGISYEADMNGRMVVELTGTRTDADAPFSLTVPVS